MDGLIEFLRARFDEDDRAARAAGAEPWNAMTEETPDGENIYYTIETRTPPRAVVESLGTGPDAEARIDHMARHHPDRVLRQTTALRAVVGLHERLGGPAPFCITCDAPEGIPGRPDGCDTLRHLATIWSTHPDYRQEWAP